MDRRTTARTWRLFYVRARAERQCERQLLAGGIEAFVPIRAVIKQWSDRKRRVEEPLFPNYLFANVDERERLVVLQTKGVVRAVAMEGKPVEVPLVDVERLRLMQREPERLSRAGGAAGAGAVPPPGTAVEVTQGPLEGLRGEVEEARGGYRLLVRVASIRMNVHVQVPAEWIAPRAR